MEEKRSSNNSFELVLVNALKIPGVKVNRKEFLAHALADKVTSAQLNEALDKGPIEAGVPFHILDKVAKSHIEKRTLQSTGASFAAGLPGGLAMAATIPADTLQFFGVALRMAQELAYIFGHKDMWDNQKIDTERVKGELTIFLGVMFGIGGSASALKIVSAKLSQQMLKKLPQQALTKTIYYPIIKKVGASIGMKITKKTFAQGLSKAIPILGGVISGGLTYASMKPMGNRLRQALLDAVDGYSNDDFNRDYEDVKREIIDITDEVIEEKDAEQHDEQTASTFNEPFSVADELMKFKQLLDAGVISQEEFDTKKSKLLSM
ncbi:bacteriochlorophyll 4-vinyl reductase [Paenibacillus odorifer]|uniref:SHOCT domain-containing protein n=1 Tax=Paenibacillus odorifer TaxID=189426 RepID=UPI00096F44FE|nr:SHOCT domain-containing protein [Paenibacillus odorifer]OMD89326.1 bacteriochlorophyll 4-vinyl reductase [Paenibacillus odorifer]